MKPLWTVGIVAAAFVGGFIARDVVPAAEAQAGSKVYELRRYTAPDGKLGFECPRSLKSMAGSSPVSNRSS